MKSHLPLVQVPFEFTGGLPQSSHWLSVGPQPLANVMGTQTPPQIF